MPCVQLWPSSGEIRMLPLPSAPTSKSVPFWKSESTFTFLMPVFDLVQFPPLLFVLKTPLFVPAMTVVSLATIVFIVKLFKPVFTDVHACNAVIDLSPADPIICGTKHPGCPGSCENIASGFGHAHDFTPRWAGSLLPLCH